MAAVQISPKKARHTWNKVSVRALVTMELAPDDSEALYSKLDIPAYVFPEVSKGDSVPPNDAFAEGSREEHTTIGDETVFNVGTTEFLAQLNQDIQPVANTQVTMDKRR